MGDSGDDAGKARRYTNSMRPNIVNLRQFYSSPLGHRVKRRLRTMLREHWPENAGLHVVGVGYANQVLPLPGKDANARVLSLMPLAQGAIYWPVESANHSVLGDDMRPPFAPGSLHRVAMLHAFEHADAPEELLKIWWQLLVPGGRLVVMLPNRHGLWTRFGQTPLRTGDAYTLASIKQLLGDAGYTLRDVRSALFFPPSTHPFWVSVANLLEILGAAMFPRMGGLYFIEAEKQIYAGIREPLAQKVVAALTPAPASAMPSPRDAD